MKYAVAPNTLYSICAVRQLHRLSADMKNLTSESGTRPINIQHTNSLSNLP